MTFGSIAASEIERLHSGSFVALVTAVRRFEASLRLLGH